MNLAQAGYRMLMILSVVDGHYQVEEGKIIVDYLTKNYDQDIDIDQENQVIADMTKDQIPAYFKEAALEFLHHSTEAQRLDFIAFIFRLVNADGLVAAEENKILASLAGFWHIDILPLIDEEKVRNDLNI